MLPQRAVIEIKRLISDLVALRYSEIERDGRIGRLTVNEIRDAVNRYNRTLVMPPDHDFLELDVCAVDNQECSTWSVELPLWTCEDGKSDFILDLTVTESPHGDISLEIDDLHVH